MADKRVSVTESNVRADFTNKLKQWFQSKGILERLELYLRSQMILEFQRHCGRTIQPQNNAVICPKTQAVKILIADFLLQEDLLFSLSVFCSEVPFLLSLSQFSNYISHLSEPYKNPSVVKKSKPRFTIDDVTDIVEALNFNLNSNEVAVLYEIFNLNNSSSLLLCILCIVPKLIKKYRNTMMTFKKIRKKEKLYKKLLGMERGRVKRMYSVLQNAYGVVNRHRNEMKEFSRKQGETKETSIAVEVKLAELSKKEVELMTWHKALELKESSLEKIYRNKVQEIESKSKLLDRKDVELQSNYKKLHNEEVELRVEKENIEKLKQQIQFTKVKETVKLQEYEHKFQVLQEETKAIFKVLADKKGNYIEHRGQQTEDEVLPSVNEYVNLMEKENTLLKLSSSKQRDHISRLTNEIIFLKNRLDYLENELKLYKQMGISINRKQISLNKCFHYLERDRKTSGTYPTSRRKLIYNTNSSSSSPHDTNLTDEIVADAKNKVKQLESESEALNRNFKSLHNVLTRNIAFTESKLLGSSSVSDSSPSERMHRLTGLSRSYIDWGSSNVAPEFTAKGNEPQSDSPKSVDCRLNRFRNIYLKRKKDARTIDSHHSVADNELFQPPVLEVNRVEDEALHDESCDENPKVISDSVEEVNIESGDSEDRTKISGGSAKSGDSSDFWK